MRRGGDLRRKTKEMEWTELLPGMKVKVEKVTKKEERGKEAST